MDCAISLPEVEIIRTSAAGTPERSSELPVRTLHRHGKVYMNSPRSAYAVLPGWIYAIAAGAILLASLSANPLLSVAALLSLVAFIRLLWRPGEPPVLAFAVSFQWIQVTSKVFHANYLGLPVESL